MATNGRSAIGGAGGAGGGGGDGLGGGIFNAAGASLTVSGTTISSNVAFGGLGGAGGAGGEAIGGTGGNDNGGVGFGGAANRWIGRCRWRGGPGCGRRTVQPGSVSLTGKSSTFSGNTANGGIGTSGGAGGEAIGGPGGNGILNDRGGAGGIGDAAARAASAALAAPPRAAAFLTATAHPSPARSL